MARLSSSQSSEDPFFNGEWIRKATIWEECLELCNSVGCFLIWYQLDLRSKAPLEEAHVRRALSLLYRKCPALSLCLGSQSGERWVRRATNPEIDFKVLQNQKIEDVRKFLHNYRHNTETGPPFCARLLLNPTDLRLEEEDQQDPEMTHNSYMFFGLTHYFVDGTSNTQIMGFFISLLNDVIASRPISNDPLGVFVSDDQTVKVVREKEKLLEANPSLRQRMAEAVEKYQTVQPLLITAFPPPAEERKPACLVRILSRDVTRKFSQKCKEEKISFNTGFSAVVNVALVDLLLENGTLKDSYEIQCFHLVNFRRYWEVQTPKALGAHIGFVLPIYKETPKDAGGPLFWEYARSLHQEILHELDSGKVLLWQAYHNSSSKNLPYTTEFLLGDKSHAADFLTSNMGDVTSKVTEGGDHVQISNVLRSSSIHLSEFPLEIECHTFRDKFSMIFSYNTAAVSAQLTENLCNRVVSRLEELFK